MIILGLGSNVGDRLANLSIAVKLINENILAGTRLSPIYETEALLKPGSPDSWNQPYLNMAVMGETHLSPTNLLTHIKRIEKTLGRQDIGTWSPRTIDIDILAYGSEVIESDLLTVPHKDLCRRPFALIPFTDLAPNWQYPVKGELYGKTAFELSAQLSATKTDYKVAA